MKNIIKKWLEKLESANKESFGNERLDCCALGKNPKTAKPTKLSSKNN